MLFFRCSRVIPHPESFELPANMGAAQNSRARADRRCESLVPFTKVPFWHIFLSYSHMEPFRLNKKERGLVCLAP